MEDLYVVQSASLMADLMAVCSGSRSIRGAVIFFFSSSTGDAVGNVLVARVGVVDMAMSFGLMVAMMAEGLVSCRASDAEP